MHNIYSYFSFVTRDLISLVRRIIPKYAACIIDVHPVNDVKESLFCVESEKYQCINCSCIVINLM